MKSFFILCVALSVATQVSARRRTRIGDHLNDILCDTCTELITELDALLKVDADQVVSTLSSLCDDLRLPANLSAECKQYVQEYVPVIFEIIESQDPAALCAEMSLCSEADVEATAQVTKVGINSKKNHNSLRKFKAIDKFIVSVKERIQQNVVKVVMEKIFADDVVCEGCKQTVQFIHDLLTNNQTQADIVSALEMVCPYLPKEFQDICDQYIELIPEILDTIANTYFMPDEDCEAVGLCPGEVEVIVPEVPEIPEPELPELPEIPVAIQRIFSGLDSFSKPTKHKKKLSKPLFGVKPRRYLRAIPKLKIKNKTKKLSKKLPVGLPKITTKFDKQVLTVPKVATDLITETAVKKNTNETWECKLCAHVISTFAEFVGKYKDQIAGAIIDTVSTFCDRLPSPYSTKCTDEVTPFLNKFDIEFVIAMYLTAGEICPLVVDNCSP